MKVWVTDHKTGGMGACIDFATVMKNVHEIVSYGYYSLDELEGGEDHGWLSLGEKYSAYLVELEGS